MLILAKVLMLDTVFVLSVLVIILNLDDQELAVMFQSDTKSFVGKCLKL